MACRTAHGGRVGPVRRIYVDSGCGRRPVAHSTADTLIPYSHALKLYAAAHEPKYLLALDGPSNGGFGGHVDALYERTDVLRSVLSRLVPDMPPLGAL